MRVLPESFMLRVDRAVKQLERTCVPATVDDVHITLSHQYETESRMIDIEEQPPRERTMGDL